MRCVAPALLVLALCVPVEAQIKPAGVFDIASCQARPSWASFALLPDWHDFDEAARCSRETGLRWVLGFYGISPYLPIGAYAADTKARADRAGLTPYLLAVIYHEEWYEAAITPGALPIPGMDAANPADHPRIIATVQWWVSRQHATLGRVFPGVPRVWLTSLVHDTLRPLPAGVEAIAIEAYVPAGRTWATTAGPAIAHALRTRREPIALVGQAFRDDHEGMWSGGPTDDIVDGFAAALRQPGIWGAWMFTWSDRATIRGLESLHHWRRRYEDALGVRP